MSSLNHALLNVTAWMIKDRQQSLEQFKKNCLMRIHESLIEFAESISEQCRDVDIAPLDTLGGPILAKEIAEGLYFYQSGDLRIIFLRDKSYGGGFVEGDKILIPTRSFGFLLRDDYKKLSAVLRKLYSKHLPDVPEVDIPNFNF